MSLWLFACVICVVSGRLRCVGGERAGAAGFTVLCSGTYVMLTVANKERQARIGDTQPSSVVQSRSGSLFSGSVHRFNRAVDWSVVLWIVILAGLATFRALTAASEPWVMAALLVHQGAVVLADLQACRPWLASPGKVHIPMWRLFF